MSQPPASPPPEQYPPNEPPPEGFERPTGPAYEPPRGPQPYEPPPGPPPYYPPPPGAPVDGAGGPSKTIAILALVFGGAALLFSGIPVAGIFIGGLFALTGIVLGIVGIFKSHRLMSIIGIGLAVLALIVATVVTVAVGKAAEDFIEDWPTDYETGTDGGTDAETDDGAGHGNAPKDQIVDGTDPTAPLPAGSEIASGSWKLTIGKVVPDATDSLVVDEFSVPPEPGHQYFMFQVDAVYEGEESRLAWDDLLFGVYFDNTLYTDICGAVVPDDLYLAPEVYAGGTATGNVCVAVPTAGVEEAVISVEQYWESGPRYFVATS
ncbi:DUF308 domain-containing protein [Glycomyces algeriensis]|uniref:DUF4190 domain-containing protein n=1 Tax=Glycomyces algeriensis TaxID=256037 RepID=A0A9W6G893_9ACTN|nr:DUF308 domain-containing protein [Glycomyces algeriensis]MDA1367961.1 DUF308 domain-containing protein [Glycomyces algeriensis]MDR7349500.1 hypothetical protein [Glycomyces algeriensis]GLI42206.1 hypothetical protein GALLR39Z86_20560 [Glycomyces algeriensis]